MRKDRCLVSGERRIKKEREEGLSAFPIRISAGTLEKSSEPNLNFGAKSFSLVASEIYRRSVRRFGKDHVAAMVGQSTVFLDLLSRIERLANLDEPVLVIGETGAGKEAVAAAIHLLSARSEKQLITVNCPQHLDSTISVSELFGHRKGSFTGASTDRKGAFASAHQGTLFLDEVGDLHPAVQGMLLRALNNGEYLPLGADEPGKADVRVVSATNRPLDPQTPGVLREDLIFRLGIRLHVPSLRDRGDDWRLLLDYFLDLLASRYQESKRLSPEALELLAGHCWPGNVRELRTVVAAGYAGARGEWIEPEHLATALMKPKQVDHLQTESLYRRLVTRGASFWELIHAPFLNRDLNRSQVREVLRAGLSEVGTYRNLLSHFNLPHSNYQKFMDFLRHHDLKPRDAGNLLPEELGDQGVEP